jgi:hypothetical protein
VAAAFDEFALEMRDPALKLHKTVCGSLYKSDRFINGTKTIRTWGVEGSDVSFRRPNWNETGAQQEARVPDGERLTCGAVKILRRHKIKMASKWGSFIGMVVY